MSTAIWKPNNIASSNMTLFKNEIEKKYDLVLPDYQALHQWSVEQPALFWQAIWHRANIQCEKKYDKVLQQGESMLDTQWFLGARFNFAENLLQHQSDKTALIFHAENGQLEFISYSELYLSVAKLADYLKNNNVSVGDRVAGFLPNRIETVIAMLATTSLGAIWSSCSPDFGEQGVMDRFQQIEPKVLFTADGYFYAGKTHDSLTIAKKLKHSIQSIEQLIVIPYLKNIKHQETAWQDCLNNSTETIAFAQLPFDHPIYILYSSGTTGLPKCIVHGAGGTLLQHYKELVLHTDLKQQDTLFYFTTCGWMMWNWMVSGLMTGATLVLFDGSPFHPSPTKLLDIVEQEKVTVFGSSAKYLAAIENEKLMPINSHDLSHLKAILSTGSPLAPEQYNYMYQKIKQDVCLSSISGGTDIISCFALGNPTLPVYQGELQCLGLGMAVQVFNEQGESVRQQKGELVCTQAFPCMPVGFWHDEDNTKYKSAYFSRFANVWAHGDYAEITEHDGLIIYGRSDAVLNPGGVRIGTAEIYRQVESLDEVSEAIAVGQDWQGDVRVILFVVLNEHLVLDEDLIKKIKLKIRSNTTPRHVPAKVIQVADIPKTISGKIVELAVRKVIHGETVKNKDTLKNPEALQFFKDLPELQV